MSVAFKFVRVEIEDGGDDNNRSKILYQSRITKIFPQLKIK